MQYKSVNIFVVLAVMMLSLSCNSSKKIGSTTPTKKAKKTTKPANIAFIYNEDRNLTKVLEKAERENKIVFLDFYADWCLPCQLMDEEVFSYRELYEFYNKNLISYKVNVEKTNGGNLKLLFGVNELPTFLFVNSKGKELKRYEGSTTQLKMLQLAKEVLQK